MLCNNARIYSETHMKNALLQALDWDQLRHFLELVRAGSVSRAAVRLGVNQTTVSRRISALEAKLGKRLFERSASGWLLTPLGERLVGPAEQMAEEANAIARQVAADSQELSGPLRITLGEACTRQLAMPAVGAFARLYPNVDIEIVATSAELDLAAREADVALRSTDEPPPNLVGKRIGQLAYAVYGNQEFLDRMGSQHDVETIPCITWIGDGHTRPLWIEKSFPNNRRLYRTSSLDGMQEMARQGMGIAQMPCALCDPDPKLHRLPVRFVEPGWGLWVLSHVDLRTTARVRIFRDHLVAALERQKELIQGHQTETG